MTEGRLPKPLDHRLQGKLVVTSNSRLRVGLRSCRHALGRHQRDVVAPERAVHIWFLTIACRLQNVVAHIAKRLAKIEAGVCAENLIRVEEVTESSKLEE